MTMTVTQGIITIVCVVLGTMVTRFLPFLIFPEGKEPPEFIRHLGNVLPYAVIGLLVVYCLKGAAADFVGTGVPQLLAVAVVAVSYKLRHSTFLSILLGTGAYMALIQLL